MIRAVIQTRDRSSFPSIISPHPFQLSNLFYQSLLHLCDIWVNFMIYLVLLAQSVWSMNRNCVLESRKVTSEHISKDIDSPFGEMSVESNSFLKGGNFWAHPLNMFDYWQANFMLSQGRHLPVPWVHNCNAVSYQEGGILQLLLISSASDLFLPTLSLMLHEL